MPGWLAWLCLFVPLHTAPVCPWMGRRMPHLPLLLPCAHLASYVAQAFRPYEQSMQNMPPPAQVIDYEKYFVFEHHPGGLEWRVLEEACAELGKLQALVDSKIKARAVETKTAWFDWLATRPWSCMIAPASLLPDHSPICGCG